MNQVVESRDKFDQTGDSTRALFPVAGAAATFVSTAEFYVFYIPC